MTKPDTASSLVDLLNVWAERRPHCRAFVCLDEDGAESEVLTFAELDRKARLLAARLQIVAQAGDRALLIFPTCLSFVVAFFGCLYANIVAVPIVPPRIKRLRESTFSIVRDCDPRLALTVSSDRDSILTQFSALPAMRDFQLLCVDEPEARSPERAPHAPVGADIAFLQYTSGSTSLPKGVMVSHQNLIANLEMMRVAFENDADSTYVGWAPLFHDMGLIANVLEPFYVGALSVLMGSATFAQKPWIWLEAITRYQAQVSGGPNFAYDLCVERADRILRQSSLDLSSWRIAFNSAEPVRAHTLDRFTERFAAVGFRREALFPCYGMADATLLISGGPPLRPPAIKLISKTALARDRVLPAESIRDQTAVVGCGRALSGEEIRIIDPHTAAPLMEGQIGEIWVRGPHIPAGYWGKFDQSEQTLGAAAAGVDERFLRTGDLGFVADGELYVTGRLNDLIIVRGRNYYPQDIEFIAESAWPGLRRGSSACFAVVRAEDEEPVLVQEVERVGRSNLGPREATAAIRKAVLDEFDITLRDVVFVLPGTLPKTSSGKVRRAEARRRYLDGALEVFSPRVPVFE